VWTPTLARVPDADRTERVETDEVPRASGVETVTVPSSHALVSFAALAFVIVVIPGPSVVFIISRAVALGRRAALLTVVGNAAGIYVQVVLVALGLGAVVERSIAVFNVVKFAGAAYLVWLGIQAIRHRRSLGEAFTVPAGRPSRSVLREGFTVGVANPKAIVFFAAILPQYVEPVAGPAQVQMLVLGLVFVAVALVCDSVWGVAAGTARDWFVRSPDRAARLGAVGGTAMIALGAKLALTRRH